MQTEAFKAMVRPIAQAEALKAMPHFAAGISDQWEELQAAYQRITQLEAALTECQSYFEEAADVIDGSYGEPAPNREMTLLIEIDGVLA